VRININVFSYNNICLTGYGDLDYQPAGYILVFINNMCTALYLVFVKRYCHVDGLGAFGLLFYNCILSVPVLALFCVCSGELKQFMLFPHLTTPMFQVYTHTHTHTHTHIHRSCTCVHPIGIISLIISPRVCVFVLRVCVCVCVSVMMSIYRIYMCVCSEVKKKGNGEKIIRASVVCDYQY